MGLISRAICRHWPASGPARIESTSPACTEPDRMLEIWTISPSGEIVIGTPSYITLYDSVSTTSVAFGFGSVSSSIGPMPTTSLSLTTSPMPLWVRTRNR